MVAGVKRQRKLYTNPLCSCGRHHISMGASLCSECKKEQGYYYRSVRGWKEPPLSPCALCGQPTRRDLCDSCAGKVQQHFRRSRVAQRLQGKGMSMAAIGQVMGGISRQRVEQLLHGDRQYARRVLRNALKAGRIQRTAACQRCGLETQKLQAHHDDYNKPLDVTWLCDPCHNIVHPHHPRNRGDGRAPEPAAN